MQSKGQRRKRRQLRGGSPAPPLHLLPRQPCRDALEDLLHHLGLLWQQLIQQLVGGRVTDGTFRPKMSFDIVRGPTGTAPAGNGKILSLREKKSEIFQADMGKEIGVLLDSQTIVQVGDKLVIRK